MIRLLYNSDDKEKKDMHYFYVMGWIDEEMTNAPKSKQTFNIYDDAVKYFKKLTKTCAFVTMFEKIGAKRKWIADTDDMSKL